MLELSISLLVLPVFWAIAEWRMGLLLCLATAILQDPLRKIAPNQPAFYVLFVGVVFAGMCVGALGRGVPLNPNIILKRYRHIAMPLSLLLPLLIMQAFNSYVRFDNPIISLAGLVTYVLPSVSIVCAYQHFLGRARIPYLSVYQMVRRLYRTCIDNSLPGIFWLPLVSARGDWLKAGYIRRSFRSRAALICRTLSGTRDRGMACDDRRILRCPVDLLARDKL